MASRRSVTATGSRAGVPASNWDVRRRRIRSGAVRRRLKWGAGCRQGERPRPADVAPSSVQLVVQREGVAPGVINLDSGLTRDPLELAGPRPGHDRPLGPGDLIGHGPNMEEGEGAPTALERSLDSL